MLCDLARHLEGAEEIDIHLMLKLLIGDILSGGDCAGAGIVDQNVDSAEPFQNRSDCLFHILGIGNIAGDADRLHTELPGDFRRDLIEQILPSGNCCDLCALACERLCHLHAETGRAAGDERDLSAQIKIVFHPSSILSCCRYTKTAHLHHAVRCLHILIIAFLRRNVNGCTDCYPHETGKPRQRKIRVQGS